MGKPSIMRAARLAAALAVVATLPSSCEDRVAGRVVRVPSDEENAEIDFMLGDGWRIFPMKEGCYGPPAMHSATVEQGRLFQVCLERLQCDLPMDSWIRDFEAEMLGAGWVAANCPENLVPADGTTSFEEVAFSGYRYYVSLQRLCFAKEAENAFLLCEFQSATLQDSSVPPRRFVRIVHVPLSMLEGVLKAPQLADAEAAREHVVDFLYPAVRFCHLPDVP